MKFNGKQLVALRNNIQGKVSQTFTIWDDICFLMNPGMVGFVTKHAEGVPKTYRQYQSTGMELLDDLANYLSSVLTPRSLTWFELGFKPPSEKQPVDLNSNDDAMTWIEECGETLQRAFEDSNFYSASNEFYRAIGSIGTASMQCEPAEDLQGRFDGLSFRPIHMSKLFGLENRYGIVDCTLRTHLGLPQEFINRFGQAAGLAIHKDAVEQPDKEYQFLHAVYPRDKDDIDQRAFQYQDVEGTRLPYCSHWINETEGARDVKIGGYYEPLRVIARWDDNTDNTYAGHGPGMRARPDLNTLNEATGIELSAYEKNVDPPTKETENNIVGDGQLHAGPGGRTVVKRFDELGPLFPNGFRMDLTLIEHERLRSALERIMFVDLIREPTDTKSGTTAFEVAKRIERAQRILGEAVGRMEQEWLQWMVKRAFSIMYRNDQFRPAPAVVTEAGGEINVTFKSPLKVSQQAAALDTTRMWVQDLTGIAAMQNPEQPAEAEIMDNFDPDGYAQMAAKRYNVPAEAKRDAEQRDELRKRKDAQKAEREAIEGLATVSGAAKDLGAAAGQDQVVDMLDRFRGG